MTFLSYSENSQTRIYEHTHGFFKLMGTPRVDKISLPHLSQINYRPQIPVAVRAYFGRYVYNFSSNFGLCYQRPPKLAVT